MTAKRVEMTAKLFDESYFQDAADFFRPTVETPRSLDPQ
jgi:hypothetical protein